MGNHRNPKFFGSKNLFSIAHPTQKNSLNSTLPLFSKSDKNGCDIEVGWTDRGWADHKSRSAKMSQFSGKCRQADRKLANLSLSLLRIRGPISKCRSATNPATLEATVGDSGIRIRGSRDRDSLSELRKQ